MRYLLIALYAAATLLLAGCDMAKDTTDTTEEGGAGAVGIAEKMSQGTVGDVDEDTGEPIDSGE